MTTLQELQEVNRWAQLPDDDGGAAAKAKKQAEAKARQEFTQNFFGNQKREAWGKKQELWEKHKALIDADPKNFNFFRVSYPSTLWATDPVTGQDRQPGEIDKAEFALEDISIRAYIAVHGPGAPSGLSASSKLDGFIVSDEQAKSILERYGQEWDLQAARVRKLKSDIEDLLVKALDPWRWNGGKIDHELIDRIDKASTIPEGKSVLYGTVKPAVHGAIGEGVDELMARAIRYDQGAGSDRSLAYALALQYKDNPSFKSRLLMLGRELDDQALYGLFRFQALYGPYATDKRVFSRLAPVHCPEFLRYGTQEQLEANLQDELNRNGVA
jgi:hypothetical protein